MRAIIGANYFLVRMLLAAAVTGIFSGCSAIETLNTLGPKQRYALAQDLPFDPATGLKLDVYSPPKANGAPVVVFYYPGRWSRGDKADFRFVARGLVSRGIVAVLPNYRLYPEVRFPAFVEDAASAVRWTHENIAAYGGDPGKIFVMGHSSGAHLAAMLALNEKYLEDVGGDRSWLRGMIGLAGPYNVSPDTADDLREIFGPPERFDEAQPIHFVDGSNPPLLLLHGKKDSSVSYENTVRLGEAVQRAGGPVQTTLYTRLNHVLMVVSLASWYRFPQSPLEKVDDFVHAIAGDAPKGLAASTTRAAHGDDRPLHD